METVKTPTKLEMRPVDALIPFADNGRKWLNGRP